MEFEKREKWCISTKFLRTKQTAKVKLENGNSYDYISRFPVSIGDLAIIGNSYMNTDSSGNTGLAGLVQRVDPKITIKLYYAMELDFVFTPFSDKTMIDNCVEYLTNMNYYHNLQFDNDYQWTRPITFFVRRMLAAASILSNSEQADEKAIELAKNVINTEPEITKDITGLFFSSMFHNVDLSQVFVDNVDAGKELASVQYKDFDNEELKIDCENNYSKLLDNPLIKAYVSKYTYFGAICIMAKGGFIDMLKVFIAAGPCMDDYYKEIIDYAEKYMAPEVIEVLKQYTYGNNKLCDSKNKYSLVYDGVLTAYKGTNKTVIIPDGVTKIGKEAFAWGNYEGNPHVKKVVIPEGVEIIEKKAFSRCRNLKEVIFPNSLTAIEKNAFEDCPMETVNLGPSVKKISKGAFSDHTKTICCECGSVTDKTLKKANETRISYI